MDRMLRMEPPIRRQGAKIKTEIYGHGETRLEDSWCERRG